MLNVFQYSRYFKYLKDLSQKESYTVTDLAKAAEVQRPYMSNVLADRAYLNSEQAFRICRFLGFSSKEQDYFLALVELEKASAGEYKSFLKKKLETLKHDSEKLINKLERPEAPKISEMAAEYYSSWEFVALHVLTSIPEFQKREAMAGKLRLPESFVQICLDKLLSWGLIKQERDRYLWASGNIHIPSNSAMVQLHHKNWRDKSIEDARLNPDSSLHFTSLYSISQDDFTFVKEQMLDVIKAYNQRAAGSKEEELVCLNLDLFRIK